jgi:hypothetical protein
MLSAICWICFLECVREFLFVGRSLPTGVITIWRFVILAPILAIEASIFLTGSVLSARLLQLEIWQPRGMSRASVKLGQLPSAEVTRKMNGLTNREKGFGFEPSLAPNLETALNVVG